MSLRTPSSLLVAAIVVLSAVAVPLVASMPADADVASADRSISDTSPAPGDSITVTVQFEVDEDTTRLSFTEQFSPAFAGASVDSVRINGQSAIPTTVSFGDDTGLVALQNLNAGDLVEVTYTVEVPSNASDGDRFSITGNVTPSNGPEVTVGGDSTVEANVPPPVSATRSLGSSKVTKGDSATVSLSLQVNQDTSRLSISEDFSPAFDSASVRSVTRNGNSVIPLNSVAAKDSVLVTMENLTAGDSVTIEYEVSVADTATPGSTFAISGNVSTPNRTVSVSGPGTVTVVQSGAARYAGNDDTVDTNELRTAISDWIGGGIDLSLLRDVISAWVSGSSVS